MMSGGVMIATKMANKCCKAANKVSRKGGRSFNPYINSAFNSDLFDSSIGFFLCTFDLYVEKYPTLIIWAQRYEKTVKEAGLFRFLLTIKRHFEPNVKKSRAN